jgi:hypothetical protein
VRPCALHRPRVLTGVHGREPSAPPSSAPSPSHIRRPRYPRRVCHSLRFSLVQANPLTEPPRSIIACAGEPVAVLCRAPPLAALPSAPARLRAILVVRSRSVGSDLIHPGVNHTGQPSCALPLLHKSPPVSWNHRYALPQCKDPHV